MKIFYLIMMKKLLMISMALCLTACSSTNAPIEQISAQYNPKTQARIRLYGQNGHSSTIHYGIDCRNTNNKGVEFNVGGASIGQAFSSLIGTVKSQSIGIPETEISRNIRSQNKAGSRAFFQEIVITAGLPVNAQSNVASLSTNHTFYEHRADGLYKVNQRSTTPGCSSHIGSFIPQAGQDYEIIGNGSRSACAVAVYQIAKNGDITPVALNEKTVCSQK
ncbi:MAG: hypothetical protein IJR46_01320 [Neisseriaceae bacterium]|nr:hypothetical protein [Neisseriaceae bacterium]